MRGEASEQSAVANARSARAPAFSYCTVPTAYCLISVAFSATEIDVMAKGQMRSNKEKRKPKQNKDDKKGAKK